MPPKKHLGPPKGADQTADLADTVLNSRFSPPEDEAGTPRSSSGTPDTDTDRTQVNTSHTRRGQGSSSARRRAAPEGMTRKTYYLSDATAQAVEDAVASVQAALGGRFSRHEIIGAIIAAGTARTDAIVDELRDALLRDLAAPKDT